MLRPTESYKQLTSGGLPTRCWETLENAEEKNIWLEITSLLIPGYNDDPEMMEGKNVRLAGGKRLFCITRRCISAASFPTYRPLTDRPAYSRTIVAAGKEDRGTRGNKIRVISVNLPHLQGEKYVLFPVATTCWWERQGFDVTTKRLTEGEKCNVCGDAIAGVWK